MIEVKKERTTKINSRLDEALSQRVKSSGNLPKVRSSRFRASTEVKIEEKEDALKRTAYAPKTALLKTRQNRSKSAMKGLAKA